MRILHTSDWHLGRVLCTRKRYEEFEAFLDWLADTLQRERIDVLLIAGDIFDTSTPSNLAQALYYRFLVRAGAAGCGHVVVTAGNHDSPSFLDAPRELLEALRVHVVGSAAADPADEVLVLRDADDAPVLIVCAVPYLRDRDIRTAEAGESVEDKERKLVEGIRAHYAAVAAEAERRRDGLGADVPIVATGHLFTAGGQTLDDDGVRELYIGSLAHVNAGIFPPCIDYVALGHLHVPQLVDGRETIRYSGSPLPMGFGEARQTKSVCLVDFDGGPPTVRTLEVPTFQRLERIRGDWDNIADRIRELKAGQAAYWLEVVYEGAEVIGDLRERLEDAVEGTSIEVLRVRNNRIFDLVLGQVREEETLDDLGEDEVFGRCLDMHNIPEEQRPELLRAYRETLASLHEEDAQAE